MMINLPVDDYDVHFQEEHSILYTRLGPYCEWCREYLGDPDVYGDGARVWS